MAWENVPTPEGADPQSAATPDAGTGQPDHDATVPLEEPSQPEEEGNVDWKKRYTDSTRGFQEYRTKTEQQLAQERQVAEQARQQAQMLQFQMMRMAQQLQPQAPPPPVSQDLLTDDEAKAWNEATIEGNSTKTKQILNTALTRAQQQWQYQNQLHQQQQFQANAILNEVVQLVPDLKTNPALAQQIGLRAQQIRMEKPYLPNELFAIRDAALEYRSKLGNATAQVKEQVRQTADYQVEGSRPTGKAMPGDNKPTGFNPMKHLSESERALVDDFRRRDKSYTYDRYWKNMSEDLRKARLDSGKPVDKKTLRLIK